MHQMPAASQLEPPVAIFSMALPFPAPVLTFDDLAEEALFKVRPARADV
jgi:hypothetical protein